MKECDVRRDLHLPGTTTDKYGVDRTGTVLYEFNSLGYRGEDYNPSAKSRICIVGESYAFGIGVNYEHSFGYLVKKHIAASLQLSIEEINLINFAVGGASADYCLRTLYRQITECSVDLVVCQLPPPNRTEYFDGGMFHLYAVNAVTPQTRESAPIPLVAYCDFYNERVGRMNLMKNILLMQAFLKERAIDYVIATEDHLFESAVTEEFEDHFEWLDMESILFHQYFVSKADRAAGGRNAGPRCHAALAIGILGIYGRNQLARGHIQLGQRIESHASHLRATDKDWEFCNIHIAKAMAKQDSEVN